MSSILGNRKKRLENQTKTQIWEESSLCPETWTKNAGQEFHICTCSFHLLMWYPEDKNPGNTKFFPKFQ
jgi:hypothetical protein